MAESVRSECLSRWPSLRLTCRNERGRYRVRTGPMLVASGRTALQAWSNALRDLDKEQTEMFRDAYRKAQFGAGIQSASEGPLP